MKFEFIILDGKKKYENRDHLYRTYIHIHTHIHTQALPHHYKISHTKDLRIGDCPIQREECQRVHFRQSA